MSATSKTGAPAGPNAAGPKLPTAQARPASATTATGAPRTNVLGNADASRSGPTTQTGMPKRLP